MEAEIEHVRNYLIIQKMRYKNKFEFEICMDEDVARYSTIKLIVQPLVENAIYHGMEYMYGDGEICVRAYKRDEKLFMEVEDNGPGMTREQTENLLNGTLKSSRRKGSGIGFSNVQERIKLYYGEDYGITLESEPDEGTIVRICLPLVSIDQGEQGEFG